MGDWRKRCFELYRALDDIDTAGDIAKGDDVMYRALVDRYHVKRHEIVPKGDVEAMYDDFYPKEPQP